MPLSLVLTVIGDDRPGLVGELAKAISQHHGNWLESSMAHLSGKFAGIVNVSVAGDQLAALQDALAKLTGLRITAEVSPGAASTVPAQRSASTTGSRRLKLALVGHDRIGIVREVSQVLARYDVNVENLSTHTASAPMSAEILFHATAELTAAAGVDAAALTQALEQLSNDLMVDITLDEKL